MINQNPYLTFQGTCEAALNFYKKAFNGEIVTMMRFGDNDPNTAADVKNLILHGIVKFSNCTVMASDGMKEHDIRPGTNMSISLDFSTMEEIETVFKNLSEKANITMPLQDTFWGARFGMLTDQFGINWMFNHDIKK